MRKNSKNANRVDSFNWHLRVSKKTTFSFNWVFVCKGSFASLTGVFFFSSPDFSSSLLSFLVWFRGFSFFGCKNLHFSHQIYRFYVSWSVYTDFGVIFYSLYFDTDFLLFRTFPTCCRFKGVDTVPNNSYRFWADLLHKWSFLGYDWHPWIYPKCHAYLLY